eukprot:CAMPEP_0183294158 /NCGR_PEP_ID=MMETSP0160_2-20130417/2597_1 /TAXON_ID=2839 ORGANISM="Odontella Sinensis, Strain Grunow 1884" /NCGR_SAMPLE_ID=MMETSP0160_2 /ASSEMBLY_ACC=CAM_ASM_000250 /LENGTH=90 /DNA_ID=CAMNT_0025455419 /DNA_START=244 /DNA_END=512 /DNA_ORIENTATION=-
MCSDARTASRGCALYSAIGAVFMAWVTAMLHRQPFYLKGLDDVDNCRSSAQGATKAFLFSFAASLLYVCYDSECRRRRVRRHRRAGGGGG